MGAYVFFRYCNVTGLAVLVHLYHVNLIALMMMMKTLYERLLKYTVRESQVAIFLPYA